MAHEKSVQRFLAIRICMIGCNLLVLASADCGDMYTCDGCVQKTTWSGECRWCPLDRKCHAEGKNVQLE